MSTENLLKEVNSYGNYGIIALVKGRNKARKKPVNITKAVPIANCILLLVDIDCIVLSDALLNVLN